MCLFSGISFLFGIFFCAFSGYAGKYQFISLLLKRKTYKTNFYRGVFFLSVEKILFKNAFDLHFHIKNYFNIGMWVSVRANSR